MIVLIGNIFRPLSVPMHEDAGRVTRALRWFAATCMTIAQAALGLALIILIGGTLVALVASAF